MYDVNGIEECSEIFIIQSSASACLAVSTVSTANVTCLACSVATPYCDTCDIGYNLYAQLCKNDTKFNRRSAFEYDKARTNTSS